MEYKLENTVIKNEHEAYYVYFEGKYIFQTPCQELAVEIAEMIDYIMENDDCSWYETNFEILVEELKKFFKK